MAQEQSSGFDPVAIEHRLTEVDERSKSNKYRIKGIETELKDLSGLIRSINELAIEVKYMREDLNETAQRLDKLEGKDGATWAKFKWLVLTALVTATGGVFVG